MPTADIRFETGRELVFHADTTFTANERTMLAGVVAGIFTQTAGLLRPELIYDLDFDDIVALKAHVADNLLLRATSDMPYIVTNDRFTALTVGLTSVDVKNVDWSQPVKVSLVVDRLPYDAVFERVAMHELLHAFRCDHIDDAFSIMSPRYTAGFTDPVACITARDADEICRVHGCDVHMLNYCR